MLCSRRFGSRSFTVHQIRRTYYHDFIFFIESSIHMSEMWGIPSPTNQRPKHHLFFQRLRNLKANLTAYIFGTKHDIHKRTSALQTTRGLLHRHTHKTKRHELWSTNGFKLKVSFHPLQIWGLKTTFLDNFAT